MSFRAFALAYLGDLVDAEGLGHSLLYEGGGSHGLRSVDGWRRSEDARGLLAKDTRN